MKGGEGCEKAQEAIKICNLRKFGLEHRQERCKKVRNAKKELGRIHHPIDIVTGKLQTAEGMKERFSAQFRIIDELLKRPAYRHRVLNGLKRQNEHLMR